MYFDMRAITLRATEDYSWQSMIGEIGGYATLLLGIAVIDLVYLYRTYLGLTHV